MKRIRQGLTLEYRRRGWWEAKTKELRVGDTSNDLGERSRRKGPGHSWRKPGEGALGVTSFRAVGGWRAGDDTQHIRGLPSTP